MRIVLLYPPPEKLPRPGETAGEAGGPGGGEIDKSDACVAPYGLLSLAAQSIRAGHQVKTFNLSTFSWKPIAAAW